MGALSNHPNLQRNPNATVTSITGLHSLGSTVTTIIIDNGVSESGFAVLDVTRYSMLKQLEIGDHCFSYVNEVKIIGMSELGSVVVGENSFTKKRNDPNRHFYVKNCPKLKSLRVGRYSFLDYSVCEIENVDALEVIAMGDVNGWSATFESASLELKSIFIQNAS